MYLRGSKFRMDRQRRRRSNPLTIMILAVLVAGAVYVNSVVVPQTQPLLFYPYGDIAPESCDSGEGRQMG